MDGRPPEERSVVELAKEAVSDAVGLEGRLWRTLSALARTPGALTEAYVAGADVYFRPTRLYLFLSLVLFSLTTVADPGRAVGETLLSHERQWLASGHPSANSELVADLRRLRRRAQAGADRSAQHVAHLDTLLEAVQAGERRAEAADVIAPPDLVEAEGGGRRWGDATEEDLAVAQGAVAGRLVEWLPLALIGLLPLYALGVFLLIGQQRSGVVAIVLSVHAHAVAYGVLSIAMGIAWASGWAPGATLLSLSSALGTLAVWQAVALRRVYGAGWVRAAAVTIGWGAGYGVSVLLAFGFLYVWALAVV